MFGKGRAIGQIAGVAGIYLSCILILFMGKKTFYDRVEIRGIFMPGGDKYAGVTVLLQERIRALHESAPRVYVVLFRGTEVGNTQSIRFSICFKNGRFLVALGGNSQACLYSHRQFVGFARLYLLAHDGRRHASHPPPSTSI